MKEREGGGGGGEMEKRDEEGEKVGFQTGFFSGEKNFLYDL